ncbi:MAG TPA: endonuclease Q family protein [bacterium]|jgi:DNA helicase-2/ATP-dependent DNA helicase PcrA|nr:endonuclease Q family protein [bacterium]
MRLICDLHIHSKYSRACSPQMEPEGLEHWSRLKGIDIVGTGDFVHPAYQKQLRSELAEAEPGLYRLKKAAGSPVRFLLSVEISLIYKHAGKTRKVHHIVLAPSLESAGRLSEELGRRGNIASDGRPILGLSSADLLDIVLSVDPRNALIPAHAWTPWFSVFGSKSGYDSLEECFGDGAKHIFAIETGLSSDRPMNRRVGALDRLALISNSDAHSPAKLGREASVLDTERGYDGVLKAFRANTPELFPFTVEFFPEEGKYHYDGHRDCRVCLHPRESRDLKDKCPVCGKGLTLGVMHRVEDLADRPWDFKNEDSARQRSLVPLEELIADAFDCGVNTQKVREAYLKLVAEFGTEFAILLDVPVADLALKAPPKVAEAVARMRSGEVRLDPGYDGEFGVVRIFKERKERKFAVKGGVQMGLL